MSVSSDQITIAVTVYNRRDYVEQAIQSALEQTVPVRVMVVEDCGPDPGLQKFIQTCFGSRIEYHRNPRRRGLFDNWNACTELCQTKWLSILHDDDFLAPGFVRAILDLSKKAAGRGFYFGRVVVINSAGNQLLPAPLPLQAAWREVDLHSFANINPVLFPGQLFATDCARSLGGFRSGSTFTGDWEMWFRLSAAYGSAQTGEQVAFVRAHSGGERGTRQIERSGKKFGMDNVQRKRNLAVLKRMGRDVQFERQPKDWPPIPSRFLIAYGAGYTPRILAYNTRLFLKSQPPHWPYKFLQFSVRLVGSRLFRLLSIFCR